MKKNILVLIGSSRVNGNTYLLADSFIKGALDTGHEVVKYEVGKANIKGCIGCEACYSKGSACVFNDDFNNLAHKIEKADVVVFATPLYWFTFPAQLKASIDKLYSFIIGNKNVSGKESMLIVCGEDDDIAGYDGIVSTYKLIIDYLGWTNLKTLIVPGVYQKGDVLSTDYPTQVNELGNSIQ